MKIPMELKNSTDMFKQELVFFLFGQNCFKQCVMILICTVVGFVSMVLKFFDRHSIFVLPNEPS